MTKEELLEKFADVCDDMRPKNPEAFDAYIKGETDEWPKGTSYLYSYIPDEITEELDGPNDALAMRMMRAFALSMKPKDLAWKETGIRALAAAGVPFQTTLHACADDARGQVPTTQSGYEVGRYKRPPPSLPMAWASR
jgi:hypothetical protein